MLIAELYDDMSAYALPGFFPPIDDDCSNRDSGGSYSLDNAVFGGTNDNHQSIDGGNVGTTMPLHGEDPSSSTSQGINCLSIRSAVDRFCPKNVLLCGPPSSPSIATTASSSSDGSYGATARDENDVNHTQQQPSQTDMDATTTCSSNSSNSFSTLIIAVKEAKIDPVRLIQYLTGTGTTPQQSHRKTLRRRASHERLHLGSSASGMSAGGPSNNLQKSPIRVNKKSTVKLPTVSSSSSSSRGASPSSVAAHALGEPACTSKNSNATNAAAAANPHGGAIEFELSITFQGRRYTAKRTLQCIVQLRDDLIREMRYRKQWLVRERCRGENNDCEGSINIIGDERTGQQQYPRTGLPPPPVRVARASSSQQQQHQQDPNEYIPEIPPLTTEDDRGGFSGGKGFMGRGFTMLHAMVTSYVPVMERWLKNVMIIVPPDSECLMDFLWEPSEATTSLEDFATKVSCTSLATLGAIKELDYDTEDSEDDDDDDEDVGYCQTSWDRS